MSITRTQFVKSLIGVAVFGARDATPKAAPKRVVLSDHQEISKLGI